MKSYNDPKKEAVGACLMCGKGITAEESVIISGKLYCKECAEKVKAEETPKKLYRSTKSRMLAGVCGGIAEYLNIDPTIIRIIFIALLFIPPFRFWFPLVAYVILWIIVPER
jgi:phage shock protein C